MSFCRHACWSEPILNAVIRLLHPLPSQSALPRVAMAPKKEAAPPPPSGPGPDDVQFIEWSEEALAAEAFVLDSPFEDPAGCTLPVGLAAGEVSWRRPSEFLELAEDAEPPVIVQQPTLEEDAEPVPVPRVLPNVLAVAAGMAAEALPSVQWVTSCFQLVARQAALLEEDSFLWEAIYPKDEAGAPVYSASGKYAVRLWEQGCWRMVLVDDRMPFDANGAALVPASSSPLELWPMILAKALYKIAAPYTGGVSQDPSVLLRLTSWLPEVRPVYDDLGGFEAIAAALPPACECAIGALLPPDASDSLAEVGLQHGPLVTVCNARLLDDGERYLCLESHLMQWKGELRDTDEDSWSFELADALEWKRLQRLRIRAAGLPLHDFWLKLASFNAHFSAIVILHRPGCSRGRASKLRWATRMHIPHTHAPHHTPHATHVRNTTHARHNALCMDHAYTSHVHLWTTPIHMRAQTNTHGGSASQSRRSPRALRLLVRSPSPSSYPPHPPTPPKPTKPTQTHPNPPNPPSPRPLAVHASLGLAGATCAPPSTARSRATRAHLRRCSTCQATPRSRLCMCCSAWQRCPRRSRCRVQLMTSTTPRAYRRCRLAGASSRSPSRSGGPRACRSRCSSCR